MRHMRSSARLNPPALVIFDCDGVLIDSEPIASAQFSCRLAEFGLEIPPDEVHRRFTGSSRDEAIAILRTDYGFGQGAEVTAMGEEALFAAFRAELQPVSGMEALIARLACPVCVASNSDLRRLENSLRLLPLHRLFAGHIYSAEMVARPKPAPDLVGYCLAQMRVAAADAVMIDDSPQGILAARAAGVRAIGFVTPGDPRPHREAALLAAGADHVAASAQDIADLLGVGPI